MEIKLPQFLYKFRRVDAGSLSMLAANRLYLASIESFNDPFEVLFPWLNFNGNELEDPEQSFQQFDGKYRASPQHTSLRVCALTEICDDIVLWGQYADCHRGFCIQFDFRDDKLVSKCVAPVTYMNEIPKCSKKPSSNDIVQLGLLTKSLGWSHEKEWRIMGHVPVAEPHQHMTTPYEPKSLTGIIFGVRMSSEHKNLVRRILGSHSSVRYFQAVKCHDRFGMRIRDA